MCVQSNCNQRMFVVCCMAQGTYKGKCTELNSATGVVEESVVVVVLSVVLLS